MIFEHWPYTNFHEMNAEWLVAKMKELITEWAEMQTNFDQLSAKFDDLKLFVENYFDNVDWQELVDNKFDEWKENGTLIEMLSSYLPYLTPEMYGAKGDGSTNDSAAFNALMAAAVSTKLPVFFENKKYSIPTKVVIPGKVTIDGNGAELINAAGLEMTALGGESIFENFTITGAGGRYPEDDTIGLLVAGEHCKLYNVSVNNFDTGILISEMLAPDQNQTGTIIDNCHVRYCHLGLQCGVNEQNPGRTTDFTITNCTFAASDIGLKVQSCVGYLISNIHVWGPNTNALRPRYGIYLHDCSLTNVNNIYIEPCAEYAMYVHSRKGVNISNVVYVATFDTLTADPKVFYFDSSVDNCHYNLENISLRGDKAHTFILITQTRRAIFNIGNIYCSESVSIHPGVAVGDETAAGYIMKPTTQNYGFFYKDGVLDFDNPYNLQVAGKTILANPKQVYLANNASGSIRVDLNKLIASQCALVEVTVATRTQLFEMVAGKYLIPVYVDTNHGLHLSGVQTALNNQYVALTASTTDTGYLDINIAQGTVEGQTTQALVFAEVKYAYYSPYATPETYPD